MSWNTRNEGETEEVLSAFGGKGEWWPFRVSKKERERSSHGIIKMFVDVG